MNYLEFKFNIEVIEPFRDMLLYHLNELEFETHEETDYGLCSYILKDKLDKDELEEVINAIGTAITYQYQEIEQKNWNAVWEEAFDPVYVTDECVICAPFHKIEDLKYKVLVNPKMAFGTGHHATTYLMSRAILKESFEGSSVLDMGCGTSVLAILCSKMGAEKISAIDIDEWAFNNSFENCKLNDINNIEIEQGGAELLQGRLYNVILANINKNVLIADMKAYSNALLPGGFILFSGFYESDLEDVKTRGEEFGLSFDYYRVHNNWTMLKMTK